MKIALLAGATGLVGSQLIQILLADSQYDEVKVITRKALPFLHPKLQTIILDFDKMAEQVRELRADDVFCCLGTTIKQAKTKQAFRKVDFEYPVEMARIAKENGARQYFLVSALGADKNSSIFYNQVKGETEEAIRAIDFEAFHIIRPSLLLGQRQENRTGEDAAKLFYKIFGKLIPEKYKAVDAVCVAKAMASSAKKTAHGTIIHESAELRKFC